MEEELLKEILESYKLFKKDRNTFGKRGKGTRKYTLDRIAILRDKLLEMQKDLKKY